MSAFTEPVLVVERLRRDFGRTVAVNDISFSVMPGEILGLLGLNGAGKTTTINMVLGVLEPTSGTILIEGCNIASQRSRALERTNFSAVYAPLPGNLTVEQNLRIFGMLYDVPALSERIEALLADFDLLRFRRTKCGLLSSGEQTRVSLAKAMLNRPHLLLLDEPTASIDPSTADIIRHKIRRYADEDRGGVLWTSHNMYEVEAVCDRLLILSNGRIVIEGEPQAIVREHGKRTLEELFIEVARDQPAPADRAPA